MMSKLILEPLSVIMAKAFQANWLVENYLEKQSLNMIYGEPGTYKSFMAMELAFCIGPGFDWYGNATLKGDVVYLAGEGASGIQKRFAALELKYSNTQQGIFVSSKPAEILSTNSVDEILKAIDDNKCKPVLIVVDTLHRNFGEGDENSSKDIGAFIKHLDLIKEKTGAAILCIHHSGHNTNSHARGSSAIRASLDTEYQLKTKGAGVELICKKMKEYEKPDLMEFILKPITINVTTGNAESAYLELANLGTSKSNRADLLLEQLQILLTSSGKSLPVAIIQAKPVLNNKKAVVLEDWRKAVYLALDPELPKTSSKQATFNRCKKDLLTKGLILEVDGYILMA